MTIKKNYQYSHGIGEQLGLNSLFSYNRIFFHSCTSDNYVIFLGLEFSIDISETKKFSSNIKHGLPLGTIFVKLINVEDYFFVIFLILKFRDFLGTKNIHIEIKRLYSMITKKTEFEYAHIYVLVHM